MKLEIETDLRRLIETRVPEGPSLEYKQALKLSTRSEKAEAVKDLSGLANGGGATIVFGIAENPDAEDEPGELLPLQDRSLVGRLEDVLRTSISPPLLITQRSIEVDGGFVLVASVQRSPLGPYMVEGYGERRYFTRQGSRTVPMTEQQVRDAYALAARSRESRPQVWAEHSLPFDPPDSSPWLSVCGLPEEPLFDIFNPDEWNLDDLKPDPLKSFARPHVDESSVEQATNRVVRWSDGISGDNAYDERDPTAVFRLHRDGAAITAEIQGDALYPLTVARSLAGQLLYLSWLWEKLGVRTPMEVDAQVINLTKISMPELSAWGTGMKREPAQPYAGPSPTVRLRELFMVKELQEPRVRNRFVRDFCDRLHQAFNYNRPMSPFRWGHLYDCQGPLRMAIGGGGLFNEQGNELARFDERGAIRSKSGQRVAWFLDGVVIDNEGRALGALEFAAGAGLPTDFPLRQVYQKVSFNAPGGDAGSPLPADHNEEPPVPLREWSAESLLSLTQS